MVGTFMNNLYRFNKWLDDNEAIKFLSLIILIGGSNAFFFTLGNYGHYGIAILVYLFIYSLLCLFVLVRARIQTGKIEFDYSKFVIPEVGDILVIKKEFWYDGGFLKIDNLTRPGRKPNTCYVPKNTEWYISKIMPNDGDWIITLDVHNGFGYNNMNIKYFKSRNYWETKSNIRDNKLKIIGI